MRLPGESDEYRPARDELLEAELELRRQTEAVAAQRRALPLGGEVATDYNRDYGAEADDGSQLPIATVFGRRDGRIQQFRSSELFDAPRDPGQHPRHVDFMWPLWAIFDLVPEGRGTDWNPALRS
jgi:predicted dithiol-disulfide oxidoreductase (DUF899 family)